MLIMPIFHLLFVSFCVTLLCYSWQYNECKKWPLRNPSNIQKSWSVFISWSRAGKRHKKLREKLFGKTSLTGKKPSRLKIFVLGKEEVQPDLHVLEFKKMVENRLKVPVNEEKLLIKGKFLLGNTYSVAMLEKTVLILSLLINCQNFVYKINCALNKTVKRQYFNYIAPVQPDLHVLEFKKMVESSLKVPVNEQKLLIKGKLLLDWKKLNDYDIKENSKLNLVILSNKESTPNTSKTQKKDILEIEMTKFLRKYFSETDAKKITGEYMKEFYRKTSACNLEDWERIATGYLSEEKMKQKPV